MSNQHPHPPHTPLNAPHPEALGVSGPDTPVPGQEQGTPARLPGTGKKALLPWLAGLAVVCGLFIVLWFFSD